MDHFSKILIVDDEEDIVEVLNDAFSEDNVIVFTASSGNKAKRVLQAHKIDVIISDIRMKDGDGIDLLAFATSLKDQNPVVYLMSGFTDHEENEVLKMGAKALIQKPFRLKEVLGRLKGELSSRQASACDTQT